MKPHAEPPKCNGEKSKVTLIQAGSSGQIPNLLGLLPNCEKPQLGP